MDERVDALILGLYLDMNGLARKGCFKCGETSHIAEQCKLLRLIRSVELVRILESMVSDDRGYSWCMDVASRCVGASKPLYKREQVLVTLLTLLYLSVLLLSTQVPPRRVSVTTAKRLDTSLPLVLLPELLTPSSATDVGKLANYLSRMARV